MAGESGLALILALDCSASVRMEQFVLMTKGCAAALRDPGVTAGLVAVDAMVSLLLWSNMTSQEVMVEWTRLSSAEAVEAFAVQVEDVPRVLPALTTAIGSALLACRTQLLALPVPARRAVIDLVGDGSNNAGPRPEPIRDQLVAAGVTINGLCVLHEEEDLVQRYQAEVIGGEGAFALACPDFDGFAEAMRQKLVREIA